MITLGLAKTIFNQPCDSSPTVLQASDLSPAVSQALAETAAWCSRKSLRCDQLRSRELDPSILLNVPAFDELGAEVWFDIKRESYKRAMDAICQKRSALLRDTNTALAETAVAQSKGKLLLYEPLETVTDGAAADSSRGFFDIEDAPPWDTWFLYSGGTIFSWVPESLVQYVQAGIDANPVDCIRLSDWSKLSGQRNV